MINSCRQRKILVCAPSNAAIDEIVYRIIKDKFSTLTRDAVLRVGSMDYEPQEDVKKHTLDFKLDLAIQKWQESREAEAPVQSAQPSSSNFSAPGS